MTEEVMRFICRLFEKHARKMRNIVARGIVSLVRDESKMQTSQIRLLEGEIIDGAERAQQYGFTSHPQNGAECFVVFAGADRSHPIILSVDDRRYRIRGLKGGEVCIYTDEGDMITLKRGNRVEVDTLHYVVRAGEDARVETKNYAVEASESVRFTAPLIGLHADALDMTGHGGGPATASLSGSLQASEDLLANGGGVSLRGHVHSGVDRGSGSTDPPEGGGS
jgi:phage baseplate assembly protein V